MERLLSADYTETELQQFDLLTLRTSSRDQVTRIAARMELKRFIEQHGKAKCDAMFAKLTANKPGSGNIGRPTP